MLQGVYGSPDPTGQSGTNQRYANKLLVPGSSLQSVRVRALPAGTPVQPRHAATHATCATDTQLHAHASDTCL